MHTRIQFIHRLNIQELFNKRITVRELLFSVLALLCLTPWVNAPIALALGILVAQVMGNPFLHLNHKATRWLLQVSVIGLGFGMNVHNAIAVTGKGGLLTVFSISAVFLVGFLLFKLFKSDFITTFLIACGTAICGGSAIASVSPVIKAGEKQISVALGVVFVLNAVALFVFPVVGAYLNLSQTDFGLWCAIAIHDTSSVVGAASKYGAEALEVATTVKLARALWIIPISLLTSVFTKGTSGKVKIPYFILGFIGAILIATYVPQVQVVSGFMVGVAKAVLVLALFLIGSSMSFKTLKAVGLKPLLIGVLLWGVIALGSLLVILGQG